MDLRQFMALINFNDMTSLRKDGAGYYLFWSPSVSGNTLNTEIFLPANQVVSNLNFEVPQVSHVVLEPTTGETQTNTLVEDTSCYSSTACANPAMQTIGKPSLSTFIPMKKARLLLPVAAPAQ